MKYNKKKKIIYGLLIILTLTTIGKVVLASPGNEDDPLVTLSYVEKRMEQIKYYFDEKIEKIFSEIDSNTEEIDKLKEENDMLKKAYKGVNDKPIDNTGVNDDANLEVVELSKGQQLICDGGTEIILRGGKATAITSDLGGLSDVTEGVDIKMNQSIPLNHLLIIPRSDGRGVYVDNYAIFMVRGSYKIK
ncbi:hypothetical protein [Dethiothermospora halolimnae]|uniref:hypothetical protein n=1 Tax=Dethiothermospora halolimnae TaxID=3114390 RepID=UPI003CCB7C79